MGGAHGAATFWRELPIPVTGGPSVLTGIVADGW